MGAARATDPAAQPGHLPASESTFLVPVPSSRAASVSSPARLLKSVLHCACVFRLVSSPSSRRSPYRPVCARSDGHVIVSGSGHLHLDLTPLPRWREGGGEGAVSLRTESGRRPDNIIRAQGGPADA